MPEAEIFVRKGVTSWKLPIVICKSFESSHRDLLLKHLFEGGTFLEIAHLFVDIRKRLRLEIGIFSKAKKVLLENRYLFVSQPVAASVFNASQKIGICSISNEKIDVSEK